MQSLRYYLKFYLPLIIIISAFTACSSDDSDDLNTELYIRVMDFNSDDPIEGALVEVCNNPYFCSNILASGITDVNGRLKLSLTESDMSIAQSFTVYKDNYMNSTLFLDGLNLSQEIVVTMINPELN